MSEATQTQSDELGKKQRHRLAMSVFWVSALGVVGLSIAGLNLGKTENTYFETIFGSVVPLLGTWVGTVMAFYFTRENFEAANRSLQQVVKQLSPDERLRAIPVRSAMIPRDKMVVETVTANNDAAVGFAALQAILKPPVTRIPVINDDKSARYVIHESQVYKFVAQNSAAGAFNPAAHNLSQLAADAAIGPVIKTFACVPLNGTLADAKAAMEKTPGAQDVIVTEDGNRGKPVLGWLTNVDITKNMNVPTQD